MAATPASNYERGRRPPATAGLDHWWLSVVRTWQRAPLTVLGRVLSDIGGPWGGTAIVAVLAVVLLLRGRIWGPSSWRSPTAAALAHPS